MIFRHKTNKHINTLSLNMNGLSISQVEKFTFLGLTINETLTWKDHIEIISNRISKTIGILSRLKHTLSPKILKMIYTSLILPRLHYCNLAWGFKPGRIERRNYMKGTHLGDIWSKTKEHFIGQYALQILSRKIAETTK